MLGGVISGAVEVAFFCPADQAVLRARLMRDPNASALRELISMVNGGTRAMYRTLGPDLYGTAFRRASLPTMLHVGKGVVGALLNVDPESLAPSLIAGGVAGAFDPWGTNPASCVRTRILSPDNDEKRLNARGIVRAIYKDEGFWGFARGIHTNMARGSVYCMTIAGTLQQLKPWMPGLAASAGAAMTAVLVVSPLDVLLARQQEATGKKSPWALGKKLVAEEGWRVFYRGTWFKLAMLVPRQAATLWGAGIITDKLFGEEKADN